MEEPLALSAPLAGELAQRRCRTDPASGETCAWYHGFWQYLRLLGMGTSPAGHAAFFDDAFARLPAGPARVLIAGGADYSMLAHAAAACRARGVQADFTMVDWCETPLALARWYAQRNALPLRTVCADLAGPLGAVEEGRYDVVCTHALFGRFDPEERMRVVANWRRALARGGRVFTANRLRPAADNSRAVFSAAETATFADTVRKRAAAGEGLPDPDSLAAQARRYAERQVTWPLRSAEEVRALFETAGLRIEHLSSDAMEAARQTAGLDVPTVAGSARYARVIAVK